MSRAREVLREIRCRLRGHRDIVTIRHRDVCERPGDQEHAKQTAFIWDTFCRYCDSGWLPIPEHKEEVKS